MTASPSRRGFFARLFGAAAAGAAADVAAPAPARCPHYHDGTFWRDPRRLAESYVRHAGGCPFCSGALPANRPDALGHVTTTVYDGQGRTIAIVGAGPVTTYTYDAGPRRPGRNQDRSGFA